MDDPIKIFREDKERRELAQREERQAAEIELLNGSAGYARIYRAPQSAPVSDLGTRCAP